LLVVWVLVPYYIRLGHDWVHDPHTGHTVLHYYNYVYVGFTLSYVPRWIVPPTLHTVPRSGWLDVVLKPPPHVFTFDGSLRLPVYFTLCSTQTGHYTHTWWIHSPILDSSLWTLHIRTTTVTFCHTTPHTTVLHRSPHTHTLWNRLR